MDIVSFAPILAPAAVVVVVAVAITWRERADRDRDRRRDGDVVEPPTVRLDDGPVHPPPAPAASGAGGLVRPVGAASLGARLQACPSPERAATPADGPPARPRVVISRRPRRRPLVARR